jgi:Valyl-tRNA synthetase
LKNHKPQALRPAHTPDKATVDGLEQKWVPVWESNGTYSYDETDTKENTYSIDTPHQLPLVHCMWVTF